MPPPPNHTRAWITAIQQAKDESDIEVLAALLNSAVDRTRPPFFAPTANPSQIDQNQGQSSTTTTSNRSNVSRNNPYIHLYDDDEEDPDEPSLDSERRPSSGAEPASSSTPSSLQIRYLIALLSVRHAEIIYMRAIDVSKARNPDVNKRPEQWRQVAELWTYAYNLMSDVWLASANEWNAVFLEYSEERELRDPEFTRQTTHNHDQLEFTLDTLDMVTENTEKHKNDEVDLLRKRLEHVEAKLSPLREDRDEVRSRMGEQRWVNNPAPKMTYAEIIIAFQKEKDALLAAIAQLEALVLERE